MSAKTTNLHKSLPSCPLSPSCEAVALIEQLVIEQSGEILSGPKQDHFMDLLLDLRMACSLMRQHPKQAVYAFYDICPMLRKKNYLAFYKLRRLFAKRIQVAVLYDGEQLLESPIDLRWSNLGKMVNFYKREAFEHHDQLFKGGELSLVFKSY